MSLANRLYRYRFTIAIVFVVLPGIVGAIWLKAVHRERESVLKRDLQAMRRSIDSYTLDKEAAPQSLDELVQAGYLRQIPVDPMTQQKDWQPHYGDTVLSPDQTTTGMDDVHSNSDRTATDGTAYNAW